MKMQPTPTKHLVTLAAVLGLVAWETGVARANLLSNGNLDATEDVEVAPGIFLPHPAVWINEGFKESTGPYNDSLSSETWAGPAPTPVTPEDVGVFFKAFGGSKNDRVTGVLRQDVAATPGTTYVLSGWAGAEADYSGFITDIQFPMLPTKSLFILEFLDGSSPPVGLHQVSLDLVAAGLGTDNSEPFNYKQYTLMGTAPEGTVKARVEVVMLGGFANPAGGGQAFVVDDLDLSVIPEPTTFALVGTGLAGLAAFRRRQ